MPTVQEVIKDNDFWGLPQREQLNVLKQIDNDFGGLEEQEQIKVLNKFSNQNTTKPLENFNIQPRIGESSFGLPIRAQQLEDSPIYPEQQDLESFGELNPAINMTTEYGLPLALGMAGSMGGEAALAPITALLQAHPYIAGAVLTGGRIVGGTASIGGLRVAKKALENNNISSLPPETDKILKDEATNQLFGEALGLSIKGLWKAGQHWLSPYGQKSLEKTIEKYPEIVDVISQADDLGKNGLALTPAQYTQRPKWVRYEKFLRAFTASSEVFTDFDAAQFKQLINEQNSFIENLSEGRTPTVNNPSLNSQYLQRLQSRINDVLAKALDSKIANNEEVLNTFKGKVLQSYGSKILYADLGKDIQTQLNAYSTGKQILINNTFDEAAGLLPNNYETTIPNSGFYNTVLNKINDAKKIFDISNEAGKGTTPIVTSLQKIKSNLDGVILHKISGLDITEDKILIQKAQELINKNRPLSVILTTLNKEIETIGLNIKSLTLSDITPEMNLASFNYNRPLLNNKYWSDLQILQTADKSITTKISGGGKGNVFNDLKVALVDDLKNYTDQIDSPEAAEKILEAIGHAETRFKTIKSSTISAALKAEPTKVAKMFLSPNNPDKMMQLKKTLSEEELKPLKDTFVRNIIGEEEVFNPAEMEKRLVAYGEDYLNDFLGKKETNKLFSLVNTGKKQLDKFNALDIHTLVDAIEKTNNPQQFVDKIYEKPELVQALKKQLQISGKNHYIKELKASYLFKLFDQYSSNTKPDVNIKQVIESLATKGVKALDTAGAKVLLSSQELKNAENLYNTMKNLQDAEGHTGELFQSKMSWIAKKLGWLPNKLLTQAYLNHTSNNILNEMIKTPVVESGTLRKLLTQFVASTLRDESSGSKTKTEPAFQTTLEDSVIK